jgi:uncharacterized membrane protein YgcG
MKTTIVLALTLTAGSAFAQTAPKVAAPTPAVDARFAAWIGCWRLDDDIAGTGARMCITPDKGGVRLQTVIGVQKGIDEVVVPDGVARPIEDSECKGTESAEWSQDGARVFRTTDVTCGKEAPRTVKSVAFLAPGPSWINIQHVSGASANTSVRVQRYRRAANQQLADGSKAPQPEAQLTLRTDPTQTRWSIEDVIEASAKLPVEAMQAALTEVHHPFDLNRRTLVKLDEGGVSEPVIDLMVALTYPRRFVVERQGGGSAPAGISTGTGWFDPFMTPMLMGGMADCYSPRGYGYRSYYSMCGVGFDPYLYGYNTGYGSYYPYSYYGGWVNVGNMPGVIGSVTPAEPQGDGRAINGRGYTQIRNREAEPSSPRINAGGNGGGWGGASTGGGASSGGYSNGGSSGGGGSSSGGDSGARVAVPKGGGN